MNAAFHNALYHALRRSLPRDITALARASCARCPSLEQAQRFFVCLFLICTLCACQHLAPVRAPISWTSLKPQLAYAPARIELSDARNAGFTSNVSWLQADAQTWLIGSGSGEAVAQALLMGLDNTKLAPPSHILSPRAHPESVLGAGFIPNAEHFALAEVATAMKSRCPECAARFRQAIDPQADPAKIGLPKPLSSSLTEPGLQLIPLQRAPGEWTSAVRFDRSLIAPGLIWGSGITPDLRDAQVESLLASLKELRIIASQQTLIHLIPEQGSHGSASLIEDNIAYWQKLRQEVCAAVQQGQHLNEWLAQTSLSLQTIQQFNRNVYQATLNTQRHSLNAQKLWLIYEDEMFKKSVLKCDF